MDKIKAIFFQNQGNFFDFQDRAGEVSPLPLLPPSCASATVKPSTLASLAHLRLGLLGIFTGELFSSKFHYCITYFIHILK